MSITAWETLKVLGATLEDLGADAELFEDSNPGEKFKLTKDEIVNRIVELITKFGIEVMD